MEELLEQVKNYCENCNLKIEYKNLEEAINIISSLTCWNVNGCETFLNEERKEFKELPHDICKYEFLPYYQPFNIDSFKFVLVKDKDGVQTEEEITDFTYDKYRDKFLLNLDTDGNCKCECKCIKKCKKALYVEYVAGYDLIPECVLPVICDILQVILDKKNCECETCHSNTDPNSSVNYPSGDYVTAKLQMQIGERLVEQYYNLLGRISLCENNNLDDNFWAVEGRQRC